MKNALCCIVSALVVGGVTGCMKTETIIESVPVGEEFELRLDEYSLNYYFVDTSYISSYEMFYQNEPPLVNPASQIVEAEVWVQTTGGIGPEDRMCVAWIDLPSRPAGGYDSSFWNSPEVPGFVERGLCSPVGSWGFVLEESGFLGVVSMYPFLVQSHAMFGIAFRRADGLRFGDFVGDSSGGPLVLKLVKPRDLFSNGPRYPVAWRMLLKNVYSIRMAHVSRHYFQFGIFRSALNGQSESALLGHPLLRILGFDQYNVDETANPDGDGVFDFRPGRTIKPQVGDIIFPSLRPFDSGIRQYFIRRGLTVPDSSYLFPELYDTTRVFAEQSIRNRYVARGRAIFN